MLRALAFIAVAVVAAVRLRGSDLFLVAVAAAGVQVLLLRATRHLSSPILRTLPLGRRSRRAQRLRALETAAAALGLLLLVWSFVR